MKFNSQCAKRIKVLRTLGANGAFIELIGNAVKVVELNDGDRIRELLVMGRIDFVAPSNVIDQATERALPTAQVVQFSSEVNR